jgi:hypothetical protein
MGRIPLLKKILPGSNNQKTRKIKEIIIRYYKCHQPSPSKTMRKWLVPGKRKPRFLPEEESGVMIFC